MKKEAVSKRFESNRADTAFFVVEYFGQGERVKYPLQNPLFKTSVYANGREICIDEASY